ncbi:hypothetical protein L2E82_03571 [Cichorium intybus]|uniref:Uncharacterized protein n=1 Tax=Cichorium intybus TaxID=13427 RepID=A0ACB9H418_CICIN|nr:hypothetical protein L2E82_03571 [Cichorium intybus]
MIPLLQTTSKRISDCNFYEQYRKFFIRLVNGVQEHMARGNGVGVKGSKRSKIQQRDQDSEESDEEYSVAEEHPTACLRVGALMAVLSYLEFFSTGVQRVALSTTANICKKLTSDVADFVIEVVPLLTNLLQYHDAKVLEHASVCLTRIVEAFATSPDKLDELCNRRLVTQAASLISTSSSRGSGQVASMYVSPALSSPPEQIFEIMNLTNKLLPPLPQRTISLPSSSNLFVKGPLIRKSPGKQEETSGGVPEKEKLVTDHLGLLLQFGMDLLPVLIQIYGSSVNAPVRHKCLSVIGKLMYFSTSDMIQSLLGITNISRVPRVLRTNLQMEKLLFIDGDEVEEGSDNMKMVAGGDGDDCRR